MQGECLMCFYAAVCASCVDVAYLYFCIWMKSASSEGSAVIVEGQMCESSASPTDNLSVSYLNVGGIQATIIYSFVPY